ncbi:hypothetical protein Q1695_007582 [Nippostrongylus brasiliensis]|nr:hypothetical protein Q1695_007582 [Nippostrongylus brasiliensis]
MFMGAAATPISPVSMCKEADATLSDFDRTQFLELHNKFRAAAANGFAYVGKFGYSQYAQNMEAMEWRCPHEGQAIKLAESCKKPKAPAGFGMNSIFVDKAGDKIISEAIEEALGKWRNDLKKMDLPEDMTFTKDMESTIGRATKMLWHNTVYLACGYADCQDKYSIVCLYSPTGNKVGEQIYEPTDDWNFICENCPNSKNCDLEYDKLCYPDWALP